MHVIYVDVLFLINWVMDFLIFFTVTLILNVWLPVWRQGIAAAIAAMLYCLLVMLPWLHCIPYSLYSLWIPVIPILYLYQPHAIKTFIKYFLVCTGVAALYGGVIFNIWYMVGGSYKKLHTMQLIELFGISVGIAVLFYQGFYWIRRCCLFKHMTYKLELDRNQHTKSILALLDTGNLLYTPIRHEPVIVLTYKAAKELLTKEEQCNIERYFSRHQGRIEDFFMQEKNGPEVLIPFHSVGCKNGYLWGITLDRIKIELPWGKKVFNHCIAGVSKEPLYADQQYEALLHPEYMIEEEATV